MRVLVLVEVRVLVRVGVHVQIYACIDKHPDTTHAYSRTHAPLHICTFMYTYAQQKTILWNHP